MTIFFYLSLFIWEFMRRLYKKKENTGLVNYEKNSLDDVFLLSEKLSRHFENNHSVTYRPTNERIKYAEKKLNFHLPPTYINFWHKIRWYHWCLQGICAMFSANDNVSDYDNYFPDIVAENLGSPLKVMANKIQPYEFKNTESDLPSFVKDYQNLKVREIANNGIGLPPFLIVFDAAAAIDDDYCCFDIRYESAKGEYPVAYW